MSVDPISTLFSIHLKVLKHILNQQPFEWIEERLKKEFEETKYLDHVTSSGLLSFDDNNKLIGAYPISPGKSIYEIDVEGIGSGYAMCAIDALGVAYTFGVKTIISTVDQKRKKLLSIIIDPNVEPPPKPDIVVSYKRECKGQVSAVDQCPSINFYLSREDVPRDPSLEIFSFHEALEHARKIFNPEALMTRISGRQNSSLNNCCCTEC
jgi:hypothetical protein